MRVTFSAVLWVALGGGLGSVGRYLVSQFMLCHYPSLSYLGTLLVNIVGTFIIGVLSVVIHRMYPHSSILSPLLISGFCGGFTTFSSFCLDANTLATQQSLFSLILYVGASLICSFLALGLGIYLGTRIVVH